MVAQPGTVRPRRAGYLKLRDQSRRGCRRWSGRGGLVLRPTEQPRGKIPSIGAEPTRIGPRAPASPNRERRVPSPLLGWSRRSGRRRARWIRNPYPLVGGCDAVAPEHVAAVRILNNPRLHRCRRNIGRVRVSARQRKPAALHTRAAPRSRSARTRRRGVADQCGLPELPDADADADGRRDAQAGHDASWCHGRSLMISP